MYQQNEQKTELITYQGVECFLAQGICTKGLEEVEFLLSSLKRPNTHLWRQVSYMGSHPWNWATKSSPSTSSPTNQQLEVAAECWRRFDSDSYTTWGPIKTEVSHRSQREGWGKTNSYRLPAEINLVPLFAYVFSRSRFAIVTLGKNVTSKEQ